jgi:hypothetical protein
VLAFGGAALLAWGSSCSENELVDSVADGVGLKQRLAKSKARLRRGVLAINSSQGIETSEEFRLQGLVAIERYVVRPISGKAKLLSSEAARETLHSSRAK